MMDEYLSNSSTRQTLSMLDQGRGHCGCDSVRNDTTTTVFKINPYTYWIAGVYCPSEASNTSRTRQGFSNPTEVLLPVLLKCMSTQQPARLYNSKQKPIKKIVGRIPGYNRYNSDDISCYSIAAATLRVQETKCMKSHRKNTKQNHNQKRKPQKPSNAKYSK